MNFLISANTDIGTLKKTNQDSVLIKKIHTCQGEMVFAVLCDGMGGLEKEKWQVQRWSELLNSG